MNRLTLILPKLTAGGTERTAVELANYFSDQNVDVTIIVMFKKQVFFELNGEVTLIEPNWNPTSKLGKKLYWVYLWFYLRKSIKKSKPDSILLLGYILIGLLVIWNKKYALYFSNRTNPYRSRFMGNPALNKLYHILYRLLKYRVNGIIAQTEVAKEFYVKRFSCPVKVIPNSLKKMHYYSELKKEDIVITIGRCVPEKGQKYFIDLVSQLQIRFPMLRFILIGDGPELQGLKKYAEDLKLRDKIEFLGFTEDVDYYLAISKYFVLTSVTEGYPNVLIESMAQGCIPFSFDCVAGPSDIISTGENGFLAEVGNVAQLGSDIQWLIENPHLFSAISENAQKVKSLNNSEMLSKEWVNFIFD